MTNTLPRSAGAKTAAKPGCESQSVVMDAEFCAEGHVVLSPGKVEIGQGIVTALAQIAADELDLELEPRADGPRQHRRQSQ